MRRTALVTGGARGLGRAIAADLARDHDVMITWNRTEPAGLGAEIAAVQADFTTPDAAETAVKATLARFGRIDTIVNNAGAIAQTPLDTFNAQTHRTILEVNLSAPAALLAAALPHLDAQAAIVSISSINATLPPRDAAIYGASKAALNLWTRAMAKELGPLGIRVNAVAPGAVNTPETPRPDDLTQLFVDQTALGQLATPNDIASAVRFLASDAARMITGEVLTVSGGYRL